MVRVRVRLDNAYDQMREVSTPLHIHVDVLPGPMLAVRDNGGGLSRGALHAMMSFGVSSDASAGEGSWLGLGFEAAGEAGFSACLGSLPA